ncbi:hypothetical protein T4A_3888 [Trichinella pseudospiralis]|uniref:Uncharacterized protein n=1 Tax=Trichinella pseudospiralis TaxID=6337 RepID=A0A0V1F1B0_TRIPS|nr:hypothetical protein T4A_3888 [Trichinella pseudospiralis]
MHLWPQLQQQHNICLMLSIKAYAYFVCINSSKLISVGVEVLQFRKKVSGCVSYCVDRSSSDQQ